MKRLISALLALLMLVSLVPTTVFAEDTENTSEPSLETLQTVVTSDGSGASDVIADAITAEQESQQEEDITNKITEVTVTDNFAMVEFNNTVAARIVVAIYDEDTNVMIASGMVDVDENAGLTYVTINTEFMPDYFLVKAFLLDENNHPLDLSYENIKYTKAYQDFLEQTVDDFDEEKVINLDSDETNNFAVYSDDTLLLEETEHNLLVSADDENKVYVFANIDENISSLQIGDIFSYSYGEEFGEYIIVKVASISIDGSTATITGESEVPLDEVFSFVKIITNNPGSDTEVDMASADEGVEYLGTDGGASTYGLGRVSASASASHTWSISKTFENNSQTASVKFEAGVKLAVSAEIEVCLTWNLFSIQLSLSETTTIEGSVTGKLNLPEGIRIGHVKLPSGVPGLMVGTDVFLCLEFQASLKFSITQEACISFYFDTKNKKIENRSKTPTFDTDIQLEGQVFIGVTFTPYLEALKVAEARLKAKVGAVITGATRNRVDTDEEKHLCDVCLDGNVSLKFTLSTTLSVKIKFLIDYEKTKTLCDITISLFDFYYSPDLGWGFGKCSNNTYLTKISVTDTKYNPISGAAVGVYLTDNLGVYKGFYPNGEHTITVSKTGYETEKLTFKVDGASERHIVRLRKEGESTGITWNPSSSGNVIHKGNSEGTTKVYFYDDKGYGRSANIYAYTYKYLPAAGVDEELGVWPGEPCYYEGANIWSIDMPNACTHILFSYDGDTAIEGQTNDIPNPGKTMIAVRGSGYEYNDVGGYHPVYYWEDYSASTASISMISELDEFDENDPAVVATNDEATADEAVVIEESIVVGDLVPGGMYAFMMLKGSIGNYTVDTDSLVYITDGIADESGNIEFTYYYEPFDGEWLGVIFGPCNHNNGGWEVINQPSLDNAGLKAQFCTKCSEVLDAEEIPAKQVTAITLYDCPELMTGDTEAINNITLRVVLDSGEYLYVSGAECTIDGYDSNVVGQQTVAVTYYGFTVDITVNVTDKSEVYRDVYFINIQNWDSVYVYYYGSAYESVEYPGIKMFYAETNSLGQDIYTASVPADITLIKFNACSEDVKTISVELSENLVDSMGWYPTSLGSSGSWNVDMFMYNSGEDNIPGEYEETVGTKTIYFTNSPGWSYVYLYYWSDAGESIAWPGVAMTYVRTNVYSQGIYKAVIPGDAENIIFNNNGYYQTVDITEGVEDGIGFYTTDYLGSYIYDVESYVYDEHADAVETEPAEEGKTESNVLIKGTFNDWKGSMMYYTDDTSTVTSTMILDPGTYEFKVYKTDPVTWLSNTGTVVDTTDTTSSAGWTMKTTASANCTLVASGGTYTFIFDTSTNKLKIKHSIEVETEPVETTTATVTEPTKPEYNELDYYLVGYINGMDYGVGDNADIFGEYKFQNGSVTVELEFDSHVIVKDSNGNYYYTYGWLGNDPGSAVLGDYGSYNDKMHVPAGTVTFNFDHKTKTLSYVFSGSADQTEATGPVETTGEYITTIPTKTYVVVGVEGLCGVSWDVSQNEMSYDGDGTWSVKFTDINAGRYEFKVHEKNTWSPSYNLEGGGDMVVENAWITVEEDNATIIIGFDGEKAIIESITYGDELETDPVETTVPHEVPSVNPAFSGASLTLQDNICINFKANESLFTEVGYENPYVVFELNGEEFTVSDYEVVGGKYIFDFADIAPNNMNDTVKATLYATFDGVEYVSETREYSVATYCYNMLNKYTSSEYAELQTLLVDLLNYGAMSQIYTNHNTDNLVNAKLTDAQKAWGTSETPTYETVQNLAYKTIDNPTVQWKGGGLNLVDAVTMRFKISADSGNYESLVVKAETDDRIWTIPFEEFTETTGGYYVYFSGLNAGEMSETVYLTVYENGKAVSNTLSYSIESYAYSKQTSTDENLKNLLEAMMKYGNSAKAYAN